jgi:hypothetical protein
MVLERIVIRRIVLGRQVLEETVQDIVLLFGTDIRRNNPSQQTVTQQIKKQNIFSKIF